MYLVYALILGRRLKEEADQERSPDRVLLCGPGKTTGGANRRALLEAGWTHIVPVEPIEAGHLDKSWTKHHALVFTKLRILELPYDRVLLLDLDLYPRNGIDMSKLLTVPAPAAKYYCAAYLGPEMQHGAPIPKELRDPAKYHWCPNAGVMRLDPYPALEARKHQIQMIRAEISQRSTPTYLPEQYYLAESMSGWNHICSEWNWEVGPEWEDPMHTHPAVEARLNAHRHGCWLLHHKDQHEKPGAKVWHFSGTGQTGPASFMHLPDAKETWLSAKELFKHRDTGGLVATALFEWRTALDRLLGGSDGNPSSRSTLGEVLKHAVRELSALSLEKLRWGWQCDGCHEVRLDVRKLHDVPFAGVYCSVKWKGLRWSCSDCIVERLKDGDPNEECRCSGRVPYVYVEWHG